MPENPNDSTHVDNSVGDQTPSRDHSNDTVHEAYRFESGPPARDKIYRRGDMIRRYRIDRLLGTGGFASVYRAEDTELERVVAVKVPGLRALAAGVDVTLYVEEAKAMAKLSHPNIVAIHDVIHESGLAIIVMEFVDGMTLRERLEAGPIPIEQGKQIIQQIAMAIAFAHDRNLIHRDLKPQNILINGAGHAFVTDFGLAVEFSDSATRETEFVGTRNYMLPEHFDDGLSVACGGDSISGKSDLWALGITAYEILTGSRPCIGNRSDTDESTARIPPPSNFNPLIEPELDAFCQKCLALNPRNRYQDADALLMGFQSAVTAKQLSDRPVKARRHRAYMLLGGTVVVLLAAIAFATARDYIGRPASINTPQLENATPSNVRSSSESSFITPLSGESSLGGQPQRKHDHRFIAHQVIEAGGQLGLLPLFDENAAVPNAAALSDLPEYPFAIDWLMLVEMRDADALLKSLVQLENVVGVDLCRSSVTDKGLEYLGTFPSIRQGLFYGCKNLTDRGVACLLNKRQFVDLILSKTPIGERTFSQLENQHRLAELRLYDTSASDRAIEFLREIQTLQILRVDRTEITDASARHFACMTSLRELGLSGTGISDNTLAELHSLNQLRLLDVSNTNVSKAGVAKLRSANPKLHVILIADENESL